MKKILFTLGLFTALVNFTACGGGESGGGSGDGDSTGVDTSAHDSTHAMDTTAQNGDSTMRRSAGTQIAKLMDNVPEYRGTQETILELLGADFPDVKEIDGILISDHEGTWYLEATGKQGKNSVRIGAALNSDGSSLWYGATPYVTHKCVSQKGCDECAFEYSGSHIVACGCDDGQCKHSIKERQ